MDPLWYAISKLRRGKLDECIAACDSILMQTPSDQVSGGSLACPAGFGPGR